MAERLWAVLAEFDDPERLVAAAKALRDAGIQRLDAFTPYPVPELPAILGWRDRRVPAAMMIGGIVGVLLGIGLQLGTSLAYPLWIGGRPLVALPSLAMICFELMVLGAVLFGIVTVFLSNRLPRLHHPLFDADRFDLGGANRFFLAILWGPGFDRDSIGAMLAALGPYAIIDVPDRP